MSYAPIPITGHTALLGILGHPLDHARSPSLLNHALRERGIDAVYVPMDVHPDDLPKTIDALRVMRNFRGAVVTMPHKAAVVPLLDTLTPEADGVGAANVLRREGDGTMRGTMLDGEGFVAGLHDREHDVRGKRVYLAGAGGAAAGVAFALARHGATALTIYNRTTTKAEDLAGRVRAAWPSCDVRVGTREPTGHDIAINGTSLGLQPDDSLPFDTSGLTPDMVVADVVIKPHHTPVLARAVEAGCAVHGGEPMLVAQIQLMIDFMMG